MAIPTPAPVDTAAPLPLPPPQPRTLAADSGNTPTTAQNAAHPAAPAARFHFAAAPHSPPRTHPMSSTAATDIPCSSPSLFFQCLCNPPARCANPRFSPRRAQRDPPNSLKSQPNFLILIPPRNINAQLPSTPPLPSPPIASALSHSHTTLKNRATKKGATPLSL